MNFTELENIFSRIETLLNDNRSLEKSLILTSIPKLNEKFSDYINDTRNDLIDKVRKFQQETLNDINTGAEISVSKLIFKSSELTMDKVSLTKLTYKNEFELYKKMKYSRYMIEPFEIIPLDEKFFDQRGFFSLHQLTRDKLIVHCKAQNLIQLYLRRLNELTYSTLVREIQIDRNYFISLHVYNKMLVVRSMNEKGSVLSLYDEFFRLIRYI